METSRSTCESCGQPAPVTVLAGYDQGKPVTRHFCLACADQQRAVFDRQSPRRGEAHLGFPSMMMAMGLLIGSSVLAFDVAGIGGHSGFGWQQQTAVIVGALLILIGALLRIDVLGLVGILALVLAACGDFIGMGGPPGVPWVQCILIGGAAVLAASGLAMRRLHSRQH